MWAFWVDKLAVGNEFLRVHRIPSARTCHQFSVLIFLSPTVTNLSRWQLRKITYIHTYLLTYLLTPWSRVLVEKLTGSASSQEIPRIFGTRRFLTVLRSARQLSLSWANSIQFPQPPPTSWRSILILSSHLRLDLPSGLFPSGFPTRTLCTHLIM